MRYAMEMHEGTSMSAASGRQQKLYQELRIALAKTKSEDLMAWGRASAARLPGIAGRRVKNLGRLVGRLAKATRKELTDAYEAWRKGKFGAHLGNRSAAGIDASIATTSQIASAIVATGKALFADPKKNAPDVFALAFGFYAGSGGIDGNGGIPDTDLALGIGWHRSVFTHSIIAGTVAEGAILALADLAQVVCDKLPASGRDPFWDQLVHAKDRLASQLAAGTSAGIAYHLAVDATVQAAPYKDLPFSMPMEGHQTLMGLNALAEGLDTTHKTETTGQKVVSGIKTAGGVAVKGTVAGAGAVWDFGKGFISGLKGDRK
jgi:hypothetical protein